MLLKPYFRDKIKYSSSHYYDMNNKCRGFALIFNHENFDPENDENGKQLVKRTATDIDCCRLEKCLKKLHFKVSVFNDLNKLNVLKQLEKCKIKII